MLPVVYWAASPRSSGSALLRRAVIILISALIVACTLCNCVPVPITSNTNATTALSVLDTVHQQPTRNNQSDVHRTSNNHQLKLRRMTHSFRRNVSTSKPRLKRQTNAPQEQVASPTPSLFCVTDHDCPAPEFVLNQTTPNDSIQLHCLDGVCRTNGESNANTNNSTTPIGGGQPRDARAERLRMLPIMIVLGVMFVGICVAMNLFSRARFKNQRSGIFANPRILKVANAQNAQNAPKKRRRSKVGSRRTRNELLARAQQMSEQLQSAHKDIDEQTSPAPLGVVTEPATRQMTTFVDVENSNSNVYNDTVVVKDVNKVASQSSLQQEN